MGHNYTGHYYMLRIVLARSGTGRYFASIAVLLGSVVSLRGESSDEDNPSSYWRRMLFMASECARHTTACHAAPHHIVLCRAMLCSYGAAWRYSTLCCAALCHAAVRSATA